MSVGLATVVVGEPTLAVWSDGFVLPMSAAVPSSGAGRAPGSLVEALGDWDRWCDLAQATAEGGRDERWLPAEGVDFLSAVPSPGNIYCAGANYDDHVEEMGHEPVDKAGLRPFHFLASTGTLTGHRRPVARPEGCERFDWEVELAVVIGKVARRVAAEDAGEVIAGYTVANDLSMRDFSKRDDVPFSPDWLRSKCYEGCLPIGPAVVPARAVADPMALDLSLSVNGQTRQRSSTSRMIFSVYEQIEHLSGIAPLLPGDLLITGTPAGTGAAWGQYLQPGDHVEASIATIGVLQTPIAKAGDAGS